MRAVIQRVSSAKVEVENELKGAIEKGYLILVGFEEADSVEDLLWMTRKILSLRIFSDEEGKMNLDIRQIEGKMLVISQFTLHAKTKKGSRPSFIRAAHPDIAVPLYHQFVDLLTAESGTKVRIVLKYNGLQNERYD